MITKEVQGHASFGLTEDIAEMETIVDIVMTNLFLPIVIKRKSLQKTYYWS